MQYTPEELTAIVDAHGKWRRGEEGGKRADLSGADLSGADLRGTDLRDAYLRGAYLSDADLSGTDLSDADLSGTDLSGTDLRGTDLSGTDLSGADLSGADLRGTDLRGTKDWQSTEWAQQARQQIRYIFGYLQKEVPGLAFKIKQGKINGTQYEGDCTCLIGSLGNDLAVNAVPDYTKGLHNPAEQLFWQIREGDTPENSEFSKMALELCLEFCPQESKENHEL